MGGGGGRWGPDRRIWQGDWRCAAVQTTLPQASKSLQHAPHRTAPHCDATLRRPRRRGGGQVVRTRRTCAHCVGDVGARHVHGGQHVVPPAWRSWSWVVGLRPAWHAPRSCPIPYTLETLKRRVQPSRTRPQMARLRPCATASALAARGLADGAETRCGASRAARLTFPRPARQRWLCRGPPQRCPPPRRCAGPAGCGRWCPRPASSPGGAALSKATHAACCAPSAPHAQCASDAGRGGQRGFHSGGRRASGAS